jgi:hypothetical protein
LAKPHNGLGHFPLREVAKAVELLSLIAADEEGFAAPGAVRVVAGIGPTMQYERAKRGQI